MTQRLSVRQAHCWPLLLLAAVVVAATPALAAGGGSCVRCQGEAPAWLQRGSTDKPMAGVGVGWTRNVAMARALVEAARRLEAASAALAKQYANSAAPGKKAALVPAKTFTSTEVCGVLVQAMNKDYSATSKTGTEKHASEVIKVTWKGSGDRAWQLKLYEEFAQSAGPKARKSTKRSLEVHIKDATQADLVAAVRKGCELDFAETREAHAAIVRVTADKR